MDRSVQTLSLKLSNRNRPVFSFVPPNSKGRGVVALFDTGAVTPVWCSGEKLLRVVYPDIIDKEIKSEVTGFGRGSVEGKVFVIPRFELSNDGVTYSILNLQIVESFNQRIGCDFVLSNTMFSHTDTNIVRREDQRIDITFDKKEYQCTPITAGNRFVVTTWVQE